MQTERLIERAGWVVRDEIQSFVITQSPMDFDSESLQGACGIASLLLNRVLRRLGVKSEFVMGCYKDDWGDENHCWVEIPELNRVVDITATQFGVSDEVFIGEPTFPYMPRLRGRAATTRLRCWEGQSHVPYEPRLKEIEDICTFMIRRSEF